MCGILAHLRIIIMKLLVIRFYPIVYLLDLMFLTIQIYFNIALHFCVLITLKILQIKNVFSIKFNHNMYGCTTYILTKHLEKKLHGNYTRMLHAILNKYWKQHPSKRLLHGHLPPISQTIQMT